MLGHGYSSAPNIIGAYKFKNLLRNTLQVFDYYVTSEDRKAIIIGHSFGYVRLVNYKLSMCT